MCPLVVWSKVPSSHSDRDLERSCFGVRLVVYGLVPLTLHSSSPFFVEYYCRLPAWMAMAEWQRYVCEAADPSTTRCRFTMKWFGDEGAVELAQALKVRLPPNGFWRARRLGTMPRAGTPPQG